MDMLLSTQNMHNWEENNSYQYGWSEIGRERGNLSARLYNTRGPNSEPHRNEGKWKNRAEAPFQPDYYELIPRTTA